MDAVKWVEATRKYAGQNVRKKGNAGPPIMSQLEMNRLNMKVSMDHTEDSGDERKRTISRSSASGE